MPDLLLNLSQLAFDFISQKFSNWFVLFPKWQATLPFAFHKSTFPGYYNAHNIYLQPLRAVTTLPNIIYPLTSHTKSKKGGGRTTSPNVQQIVWWSALCAKGHGRGMRSEQMFPTARKSRLQNMLKYALCSHGANENCTKHSLYSVLAIYLAFSSKLFSP